MTTLPSIETLKFIEGQHPKIQIQTLSNAERTLLIRGFTKWGVFEYRHTTNPDRSRKYEEFSLPETPFMVMVSLHTGPLRRGECYAKLSLMFGGFFVGQLCSAYVTDDKSPTWPPGVFEAPTEGPGLIVLNVDETLDDSDKVFTAPTNVRWKPLSLWSEYYSTATAGSRELEVVFRDPTDDQIGGVHPTAVGASQTAFIWMTLPGEVMASEAAGTTVVHAANEAVGNPTLSRFPPLPDLILPQGYDVRIYDVAAIDPAADDLIIEFLTEEWLED